MDRGDVALAAEALDAEPAVLALACQPVLEHHRGRHDVGALQVGHVVALDPQRRLLQPERLLDLVQRPAAGGQVAGPAHLVLCQRFLRVARHGLKQRLLVPALRHPQADPAAAAAAQPFLHGGGRRRQDRDEHLARDAAPGQPGIFLAVAGAAPRPTPRPPPHCLFSCGRRHGVLAVDLAEELLHQFARGHVLDLVHHPAALAANPAAAHIEHLHGGFELVLGERDHIAVGAVAEHHGLPLQRPVQRLDVVPQPRGALVLLGLRRLAHLRFEPLGEPGRLPGHEVAEILGELPVPFLADLAHARRRALADVAEQARPADLPGALEHARRTGAHREHPQQRVHGLPDRPRVRVRPEITGAAPLGAPHHHDPRVVLAERDRQVGVALVVPVPDVEPGAELLDPGVLQLQ